MPILLFGNRGMLGNDLERQLKAWTNKVVGVDREEVDITNSVAVKEIIEKINPDIIVNATGFTDVDGAELNREVAYKLNSEAIGFLVDGARAISSKLVHFSTEMVFDGENQSGYDETALPHPINIYGQSKAAGEKYVIEYEHGFLIRTSWLYGKTPQRGKPRAMNFIETIIKFSQERAEVKVVNDQYGKLTYTKDLAEAVVNLLKGHYNPGIYHLVNEGVCSWYEIAQEIWRIKKLKTPLLPIASTEYCSAANRPRWGILINRKFSPLRFWQKALVDYIGL